MWDHNTSEVSDPIAVVDMWDHKISEVPDTIVLLGMRSVRS